MRHAAMYWDGHRAFGPVPEANGPSPQPLLCPPARGKRGGRQEITHETGGGGVLWGTQMLLEANPGFKELMALVPLIVSPPGLRGAEVE